jgi:hypothetical protein
MQAQFHYFNRMMQRIESRIYMAEDDKQSVSWFSATVLDDGLRLGDPPDVAYLVTVLVDQHGELHTSVID